MDNKELMHKRRNLANTFQSVFQRLLCNEKLDLYEEGVSSMFEVIAAHLFAETPDRKRCWYDGVDNLTASVRKACQVEFNGAMWVGDDRTQWKEDFRARVTDKRVTNQGIWITLWIGSDKAEGDLSTAFGFTE